MITSNVPHEQGIPGGPVWLESVVAVPSDSYSGDGAFLSPGKVDRSGEFALRCGRDHFHLSLEEDLREGSFCRDAVVSLAAEFNGGALDCDCDRRGASPFNECQPIGGQCTCK